MFWLCRNVTDGPLIVYGGAIEDLNADVIKYERHIFIGDTKDGGVGDWIADVDGVQCTRYKYGGDSEKLALGWRAEKSANARGKALEMIGGSCHCRGVEFYLTRPDEQSSDPSLTTQPDGGAWWLAGTNNDKYTASCCACDSCRQSAGTDFVSWAYVPRHNIRTSNGSDFDLAAFKTLKTYNTSEKSTWCFCSRCGANCFLILETQRPNVVDVATGLLWSGEGAKAEDWLVWKPERFQFNRLEDGGGRPLVEALRKGFV